MKISKAMAMMGLAVAAVLLSVPHISIAETFMTLQPGRSTRSDAEKKLGAPIREVVAGVQYDYEPRLEARRLSITFHRKTGVIRAIDVYSRDPYLKDEYREWLQLGSPAETRRDDRGYLVEMYPQNGVALHFSGRSDNAAVEYIRHYDPAPPAAETPTKKPVKKRRVKKPKKQVAQTRPPKPPQQLENAADYDREANIAINAKDWHKAKRLIAEGLRRYPDSADLWHTRASYYFKTKMDPREVRSREAIQAMYRAYKLNPTAEHSAEMGWLHLEFHNDCTLALSYFREAEKKGYAGEQPALFYWMGACYEKIGMYTSSKTYYKRFLDTAPKHEKRSAALAGLDRLRRY